MPDPTSGCVNEHELMMLVCVVKFCIISDKLTAIMLVIGLIALSILVNTMNDPTLITNHNRPAGVDTIPSLSLDNLVFWPEALVSMMIHFVGDIR